MLRQVERRLPARAQGPSQRPCSSRLRRLTVEWQVRKAETRNSSAADNYPDKLAAAQRLIDNGDWSGALQAYVALIEQYPERPAASRSLENFLTDWSTNERKSTRNHSLS